MRVLRYLSQMAPQVAIELLPRYNLEGPDGRGECFWIWGAIAAVVNGRLIEIDAARSGKPDEQHLHCFVAPEEFNQRKFRVEYQELILSLIELLRERIAEANVGSDPLIERQLRRLESILKDGKHLERLNQLN